MFICCFGCRVCFLSIFVFFDAGLTRFAIQAKGPDGKWTRKPLAYRESNNVHLLIARPPEICVNLVFKHIHAASSYTLCRQFVPFIYCPRVPRVRFVSLMYVALQFSHVMQYTPSHIFHGSTLSFFLTSDLLMVLWGFTAVYTLYFFMIRDVVLDNPWTYGSTTMPLLLSSCYLPRV